MYGALPERIAFICVEGDEHVNAGHLHTLHSPLTALGESRYRVSTSRRGVVQR
jgi:hypothetical protein